MNLWGLNPTSARAKILPKLGFRSAPSSRLSGANGQGGEMKSSLHFNLNACSVLNRDYLGC